MPVETSLYEEWEVCKPIKLEFGKVTKNLKKTIILLKTICYRPMDSAPHVPHGVVQPIKTSASHVHCEK